MRFWWEKYPERYEFELAELEKAGFKYKQDQQTFEKGILELNIPYKRDGRDIGLIVRFPDVYPYFRFEIYAPELNLDHHQNPFEKNLCMIGRNSSNWHTTDTVAEFLNNQLPLVLKTGERADSDTAKPLEEDQGEPITTYYHYAPDSAVLIDSSWIINPSVSRGALQIGVDKTNQEFRRMAVLAVEDFNGNVLVKAEPEIINLYQGKIKGRWIRSDQPIIEKDIKRFYERLVEIDPSLSINRKNSNKYFLLNTVLLIGVLFPEELSWRKNGDGWVFFLIIRK